MSVWERESFISGINTHTHTFHAYNFNALLSFKDVCFACWSIFENLSMKKMRGHFENYVGDGLLVLVIICLLGSSCSIDKHKTNYGINFKRTCVMN